MNTKKEAALKGKKLLKQMAGRGWKLRVWENLGWHYCVNSGPVSVYPSYNEGNFFCLISTDPKKAGFGGSAWTNSSASPHKNPNQVVWEAFENMSQVVDKYLAVKKAAAQALGY